ncbi:helix-turn-helix transcriptional regulator [Halomonas aquamarina]|uniref:Helix-turn-helix transcriptional regulator n=1 Tax=Vreelandella aquamarina TaxID=77097 RepID=A0ACC5VS70_9GAMM|nr:AraC family transcriptional regulator [Halomonas aquamarina]MBZ5486591.1 helix-turn-helix transcriptional regulator [Halomonas aquamarina]
MGETSAIHEISAADLRTLSAPLVKRQRLEAPAWDQRSAPLTGRMWVAEIEPGMQLRLADVQDRFGLTSQAVLPAGVKIALVMGGTARVRYGASETRLGVDASHCGLLVILPAAASFTRLGQAGVSERTLTLTLSPHWLDRHGYRELLTCTEGAPTLSHWTPSSGLFALALRLFSTDEKAPHDTAARLQLAGLATMLAGEALACLPRPYPRSKAPTMPDHRLARLMHLIDSGQAKGVTQTALAKQLGMSVSTLQRRFYHQQGEALGSFLRRHHLALARNALAQQAISIDAAAALAGYTNATNFATAFKREYGIAPREYRRVHQRLLHRA